VEIELGDAISGVIILGADIVGGWSPGVLEKGNGGMGAPISELKSIAAVTSELNGFNPVGASIILEPVFVA